MVPLLTKGEDISQYSDTALETMDFHMGMMDEDEVKKMKRRMKNKISAQESRRRKKEYVDTLETRLKQRDEENSLLREKLMQKEEENRSLVNDLFAMKQKQSRDENMTRRKPCSVSQISRATQVGTCVYCYQCHQDDRLTSNGVESKNQDFVVQLPHKQGRSSEDYVREKPSHMNDSRPYSLSPTFFRGGSSGFHFSDAIERRERSYEHRSRYNSHYNRSPYSYSGRSSLPTSSFHTESNSDIKYKNKTDNFIYQGRRSNESRQLMESSPEMEVIKKPTPVKLDQVSFYKDTRAPFFKPTNIGNTIPTQSKSTIYSPNGLCFSGTTPAHSSIMETSSLFSQLMNTDHLSSPSHT